MTDTEMPAAPFARPRYTLGDLELAPVGDDLEAIATGLAAIDPWARVGRRPETFRAYFNSHMAATYRFALRRDGRPIGALTIRWPFMRGPYIELIGLFPEAQGQGLARRIVAWMEGQVADEATNIWLCVTDWNTPARAAYAALGFVEIGPISGLAAGGTTEIFMRKPFAPPLG